MIQRMKYRIWTEIVSLILEAANGEETKIKIMYKAFLSFVHSKGYLSMLFENWLIECDAGRKFIRQLQGAFDFLRSMIRLTTRDNTARD